jgi:glycosyltransferase involved in cell wall biosynthesis
MTQVKKKLLMITCDGGIAYGKKNVFYEMLKEFSTHFERIDIICPSNEIGEEIKIHHNVHLHPSKITKKFHMDVFRHKGFVVKKGVELIEKHGHNLIDAHFVPPFLTQIRGGLKLSKKTGVPMVGEFMHLPGLPKSSCFSEWVEMKISVFFLRRYRKKVPNYRIINKGEIGKYFTEKLKFPPEKLHFVSSIYLDFDLFHPMGLVRNPNTFVVAGRLAKNKGLLLIAEAISIVKETHPQVCLKIVGEGEMKEPLQKYIKKNKLGEWVKLLGWLPTQADVGKLYNEVQASIMASANEGGPRVVFESMACRTPVLTTRVGETKEMLKDEENGLFIDWDAKDIAKKIIWVIEHPKETREMGEEALATVQPWEKKKILARYAKTLHKLMV